MRESPEHFPLSLRLPSAPTARWCCYCLLSCRSHSQRLHMLQEVQTASAGDSWSAPSGGGVENELAEEDFLAYADRRTRTTGRPCRPFGCARLLQLSPKDREAEWIWATRLPSRGRSSRWASASRSRSRSASPVPRWSEARHYH